MANYFTVKNLKKVLWVCGFLFLFFAVFLIKLPQVKAESAYCANSSVSFPNAQVGQTDSNIYIDTWVYIKVALSAPYDTSYFRFMKDGVLASQDIRFDTYGTTCVGNDFLIPGSKCLHPDFSRELWVTTKLDKEVNYLSFTFRDPTSGTSCNKSIKAYTVAPPTIDFTINGKAEPQNLPIDTALKFDWKATNITQSTNVIGLSCYAAAGPYSYRGGSGILYSIFEPWHGYMASTGTKSVATTGLSMATFSLSCEMDCPSCKPSESDTYILWWGNNSSSKSISVAFEGTSDPPLPPEPVVQLTVDLKANNSDVPISVTKGSTVKLDWQQTGATNCWTSTQIPDSQWDFRNSSDSGGWVSIKAGDQTGLLPNTYVLNCTNGTTNTSDSVLINVTEQPVINLPVINSFTADPTTIDSGAQTILKWATTDAASCSGTTDIISTTFDNTIKPINSAGEPVTLANDSTTTGKSYKFTLKCSNLNGASVSKDQTVTVNKLTSAPQQPLPSSRAYRIIISWDERGVTRTQEYKSF